MQAEFVGAPDWAVWYVREAIGQGRWARALVNLGEGAGFCVSGAVEASWVPGEQALVRRELAEGSAPRFQYGDQLQVLGQEAPTREALKALETWARDMLRYTP